MQSEGFKNIGIGLAVLLAGWGINRFLKKRDEKDTQGTDAFQEEEGPLAGVLAQPSTVLMVQETNSQPAATTIQWPSQSA